MSLSLMGWAGRCCKVNKCSGWGVIWGDVWVCDVWIVGWHVQGYGEMCWLVDIVVVCDIVCVFIEVELNVSVWFAMRVVTNE